VPDNEKAIRDAYNLAEAGDVPGWVNAFTEDGMFTDMSTGSVYRDETLGDLVEIYGTAFSDMHRELYRFYTSDDDDVVVVQLALQGTHDGPLVLPTGTFSPTGRRMDAPCCDVFELVDGKIKRFDCYPSGTVIQMQLGLLGHEAPAFADGVGTATRPVT
jgi:ketosteroid isomerase-like protein